MIADIDFCPRCQITQDMTAIKCWFCELPFEDHKMPLLVSRETAALELGVSTKTIDRLITRGHFKPCRIGKSVRIPFNQLEIFAKGDHPNG